ncbi:MAG TPA: hypothetical protein PKY81_10225 [bacterium]|nr:hypothetical protein [bacterium]HPN31323.1 hypothetical protein [bacterium]
MNKKKIKILVIIFLTLSCRLVMAGDYSIIISPVFIDDDGSLFANASTEYRDMTQYYPAGGIVNNNRIKAAASYEIKTKTVLVATVVKRGMPVPDAEIIWRINSGNAQNAGADCFITNYSEKDKSTFQKDFLKTYAVSEKKTITAQQPKKSGLYPRGSNKYQSLIIHPGQSFVELTSTTPGFAEISATLSVENNPEKNTAFTVVEWLYPDEITVDLSISDNSPFDIYDLGSGEKYISVKTILKVISGKKYEDILSVSLPESFDFFYPENEPDFISNFDIFLNDEKIARYELEKKYSLAYGIISSGNAPKKYVSVKIGDMTAGDVLKISVKTVPTKKIEFDKTQPVKTMICSAMLHNYQLIKHNPITLTEIEENESPDFYFSNLDVQLTDLKDPAGSGDNIKYELRLLNSGKGRIKITDMILNTNSGGIPSNSNLTIYESGRKTINFGSLDIKDYLNKPESFYLNKQNSEAVLTFELNVKNGVNAVKTGIEIKYELSKKYSDGSVKRLKTNTIADELTKITE